VHVLARQGRAPAVGARVSIGLQRTEATTQEQALEALDVGDVKGHDRRGSPPPGGILQFLESRRSNGFAGTCWG
jgi:hypothetical protein